MAAEARRGCGYRKIGGTYLEGDPGGFSCGRLPVPLVPCHTCGQRPAFTRSIQRVEPRGLLHSAPMCRNRAEGQDRPFPCVGCPFESAASSETAGLMWVGDRFYTPAQFGAEAAALGVSKRVPYVPKWLEVGRTWVFLAHEKVFREDCGACGGTGVSAPSKLPDYGKMKFRPLAAVPVRGGQQGSLIAQCEECGGEGKVWKPGIFYAFQPARVVRMVPDTMPEAERKALEEQGFTPVAVPHDDPDHQPSKTKRVGRSGGGVIA